MALLFSKSAPNWYNLTKWYFFFQDYLRNKEQHLFEIETFCIIINVITITFDQFNASLKILISFPKKNYDHKLLNGSVCF